MASTFTTNKVIEKPGNGDYVDTWNVPVNGDMDIIDAALGGTTLLNATGGSATLQPEEYQKMFLGISGSIGAPVTYTIPTNKGGMWIVYNSTTDASGGPHAITIASGGGGTSVAVPRLTRIIVVSDGTNISSLAYVTANGTVNGTLTISGALTAQSTLAVTGAVTAASTLAVTGAVTASSTLAVTGAVTGSSSVSDSIGNVRNVPSNGQSTAYVLLATDNGKFIKTNAGVTVPSGVFSTGNTISIYNNSASSITITEGSGVTMRLVGSSTVGNRTLALRGLATILCVNSATNEFVITGGGLT